MTRKGDGIPKRSRLFTTERVSNRLTAVRPKGLH
jgi:hypothetical protein